MFQATELMKYTQAQVLIGAGLRLSIIRGMTGLGTRVLRAWWWEVRQEKPPNGKLPETCLSFIKDKAANAAILSAYAAFHQRLYGDRLDVDTMLTSWRHYQEITGQSVDINAAYYTLRDIRAAIVLLVPCQGCGLKYIYDRGGKQTSQCPFCRTTVI